MWRFQELGEAIIFRSPFKTGSGAHILFQLGKVFVAGRLLAIPMISFLNNGGF